MDAIMYEPILRDKIWAEERGPELRRAYFRGGILIVVATTADAAMDPGPEERKFCSNSFRLGHQDFLRRDGKVADAKTDRVVKCIRDGGSHARRTEFTDALGAQRT